MSLIQNALLAVLPPNRKKTPSGWESFNAPCCHHRGNRQDDRKRGGIMVTGEGFTFHCFNCGFKAGWTPGKLLSQNTRKLFTWLGIPETEVQKLALEALKEQQDQPTVKKQFSFELEERDLPDDCLSIKEWVDAGCQDTELVDVISYLLNRGMDIEWYNWHWSSAPGFRDRVIIPFYQDNKIVGYTGRKITEGKPKYLTDAQPGYVFNLTAQPYSRKYVIVTEGQFDAIAIDGVAISHNEPNETQCTRLNMLGREVIVVPDRDRPGAKLLKAALDHNWSASMPPWANGIKDVADAVKRYGRLYTLATILHYKESNQIKIQLLKKKLEHGE
jgi:hypothetical protein